MEAPPAWRQESAGAFIGVGQRQEGEETVAGTEGHQHEDGLDVGKKIALGEHHPLGLAGGARGVDEGGQVVTSGRPPAVFAPGLEEKTRLARSFNCSTFVEVS